jgi:hypothetical protein
VNGLAALLRREEWRNSSDGELIKQRLRRILDDQDADVRMLASMALPLITSQDELSEELQKRLLREENKSVKAVLVQVMAGHAPADPGGTDECLRHMAEAPAWSPLAGTAEDRTRPLNQRHSEISDLLLQTLLYLHLEQETPFASALIATWQRSPEHHPATIRRLVTWARRHLNPPGETNPPRQARAFALLGSLTASCRTITASVQDQFTSAHGISAGLQQDLQSAAWIADSIAQELYHASGAYQPQQDKPGPDKRAASPSFCEYALPLIEDLADIPTAGIAHHLVQTLAFLSTLEPRRAFLAIAKIATPGSGYEYESLGETEVLGLIDQYLAERRAVILGDAECLGALRKILETFVSAGSDRAIHRVQDLAELFR